MPKVVNYYKTEEGTYIGRGSKWGNPFVIPTDGTREQVIAKYKAAVLANPALMEAIRRELKGKDLRCFCAPKACHGDILLEIANGEPNETKSD